jgi:tRNA threonylcarbamoyladenosine biosynthesis protein TsaE
MHEPGELRTALGDEAATRAAGAALARAVGAAGVDGALVTLSGELGAGKTTLVRGFLEALGVPMPIRSPTYTLIESYPAGRWTVHHLDWYRLAGGSDLEGLGFRDLLGTGQVLLVEWPERAPEVAAQADVAVTLDYASPGRVLGLRFRGAAGEGIRAALGRANALG